MKLEDLQKIVDARHGFTHCDKELGLDEMYKIIDHIDEIMDVLRAAKELTEVTDSWLREYGWCPDHLHPDDKFRLLKEALEKLESK